jgi:hypothetical protein
MFLKRRQLQALRLERPGRSVLAALILLATVDAVTAKSPGAPQDAVPPAPAAAEIDPATVAEAREVFLAELRSRHDHMRWAALRAATVLDSLWIAESARPMAASPDILERVLALEVIARVDPELGREEFIDALHAGDRAIRLRGLQGLERLADPGTTTEVASLLEREEDPDLRSAAARALGAIGDAAAVPALYTAAGDSHATVRRQAVAALLAIGDTNIGRYLVSRLEHSPPDDLQTTLQLLTQVGNPELVPEIEPYLEHPHDPVRMWAAAAILAASGDGETTAP